MMDKSQKWAVYIIIIVSIIIGVTITAALYRWMEESFWRKLAISSTSALFGGVVTAAFNDIKKHKKARDA